MSIVSVYCVPIVSIAFHWGKTQRSQQIEQTSCFIVFSLKHVDVWSVLLCVSLKQPCKVWLIIVSVHINSPNPYIYRCKFLDMFFTLFIETLIFKAFWKRVIAIRGAAGTAIASLVVCFCVVSSLMHHQNPYRSATSVREKQCVLLCFRSNMLNTHLFYTVPLGKHGTKTWVLLCFRSTLLKHQWFYCVFAQKAV